MDGAKKLRQNSLVPAGSGLRLTSPWHDLARCSTAAARACLPFDSACRLPALPLGLHEGPDRQYLSAAVAAPERAGLIRELVFISGREVAAEYLDEQVVRRAVALAYRGAGEEQHDVPAQFRSVVRRALLLQASDIHIEPDDEGVLRLRYRIAGRLRQDDCIETSKFDGRELVRRIKVLAELDTTIRSRPQEGAIRFREEGWDVRLRVSIVPQVGGEKAVLRVLHNFFFDAADGACPFLSLGLSAEQREGLLHCLQLERGVLLLSGPTGSGKSTLLYAAMQYLNDETKNLVSIEDPIERRIPGICQTEVDSGSKTFAGTLKAMLRQDPDVLMLGEIRDREAAETALTAGLTGALVLSTVHAGSCYEVLQRLRRFGVCWELLCSSVRLLSRERLVLKNWPDCRQPGPPDELLKRVFQIGASQPLFCSAGCDHCRSGGAGRVGVFELLPLTEGVCRVLRRESFDGAGLEQLSQAARQAGFRSLAFSVRRLLLEGQISAATALAALGVYRPP